MMPLSPFLAGTLGSLLCALATGLGGVGILVHPSWTGRRATGLLTVVSALMLGAAVFSLSLPASRLLAPRLNDASLIVALMAGLTLGAVGMRLITARTEQMKTYAQGRSPWIVLLALALHNIPEGLAVGTAMAGPSPAAGLPLLTGIFLHNLPEGLALASLVLTWGWHPRKAAWAAFLTGLTEPAMGILAAWGTTWYPPLLPWILLGTAGAMLELVRTEIIPTLKLPPRNGSLS